MIRARARSKRRINNYISIQFLRLCNQLPPSTLIHLPSSYYCYVPYTEFYVLTHVHEKVVHSFPHQPAERGWKRHRSCAVERDEGNSPEGFRSLFQIHKSKNTHRRVNILFPHKCRIFLLLASL